MCNPRGRVKITVLLARPDLYKEMNEAYAEFFPGKKLARAMARFGADIPGVLVAIEAIALAYQQGRGDAEVEPVRIGMYRGIQGSLMCDFNSKDRTWRWFGEENGLALDLRPDLDIAFVTSMARTVKGVKPKEREAGGLFAVHGLGVRGLPEPRFAG